MKNIMKLTVGELNRMVKYKILPISIMTSVLWCVAFFFVSKEEANELVPIFLFADVAIMSILLIGASFHLEKQEGTIKSLMMLPVSKTQILVSKTIASMVLALESLLVISIAMYFIHSIAYNYFFLALFMVIAAIAHASIGFSLSLLSRDFSGMLGILMSYMFLFSIPSVLYGFQIIPARFEWILMLSPSHCAFLLISNTITGEYELGKILFSISYLIVIAFVLFYFNVYPKFKSYAVRG